jgi:hypothetical protein
VEISGGGRIPVFRIAKGAVVFMIKLTIYNGKSEGGMGGGIDNAGQLIVGDCLFKTPTGNLTPPRMYHTATLLNDGTVLIAGGYQTPPSDSTLASAEIYDPSSGTFSQTGSMAAPRAFSRNSATLLPDGSVLIVGGAPPGNPPAEIYDPGCEEPGAGCPWSGCHKGILLIPSLSVGFDSFLAPLDKWRPGKNYSTFISESRVEGSASTS